MNDLRNSKWPDNADGDVFRRMESHGFDFSKIYEIDFNIDFESWPPKQEAFNLLEKSHPSFKVHHPIGEYDGYVSIIINEKLNYDLVIRVQNDLTNLMKAFGGYCDSWGVLQN